MPDIRLVQQRGPRLWLITGVLAVVGLLVWASALFVGDATEEQRQVGANADFGALRAPVLPAQAVPFQALTPLRQRDLGRLVHLTGVVESRVTGNAAWVRSNGGRRILVRFEPDPPPEALRRIAPGSAISLDGYVDKISQAELEVWLDSLRVAVPRPPPGRKFGDLPDSSFSRVEALFVKDYYISVRPEALQGEGGRAPGVS
jgi:hypothetical protein